MAAIKQHVELTYLGGRWAAGLRLPSTGIDPQDAKVVPSPDFCPEVFHKWLEKAKCEEAPSSHQMRVGHRMGDGPEHLHLVLACGLTNGLLCLSLKAEATWSLICVIFKIKTKQKKQLITVLNIDFILHNLTSDFSNQRLTVAICVYVPLKHTQTHTT